MFSLRIVLASVIPGIHSLSTTTEVSLSANFTVLPRQQPTNKAKEVAEITSFPVTTEHHDKITGTRVDHKASGMSMSNSREAPATLHSHIYKLTSPTSIIHVPVTISSNYLPTESRTILTTMETTDDLMITITHSPSLYHANKLPNTKPAMQKLHSITTPQGSTKATTPVITTIPSTTTTSTTITRTSIITTAVITTPPTTTLASATTTPLITTKPLTTTILPSTTTSRAIITTDVITTTPSTTTTRTPSTKTTSKPFTMITSTEENIHNTTNTELSSNLTEITTNRENIMLTSPEIKETRSSTKMTTVSPIYKFINAIFVHTTRHPISTSSTEVANKVQASTTEPTEQLSTTSTTTPRTPIITTAVITTMPSITSTLPSKISSTTTTSTPIITTPIHSTLAITPVTTTKTTPLITTTILPSTTTSTTTNRTPIITTAVITTIPLTTTTLPTTTTSTTTTLSRLTEKLSTNTISYNMTTIEPVVTLSTTTTIAPLIMVPDNLSMKIESSNTLITSTEIIDTMNKSLLNLQEEAGYIYLATTSMKPVTVLPDEFTSKVDYINRTASSLGKIKNNQTNEHLDHNYLGKKTEVEYHHDKIKYDHFPLYNTTSTRTEATDETKLMITALNSTPEPSRINNLPSKGLARYIQKELAHSAGQQQDKIDWQEIDKVLEDVDYDWNKVHVDLKQHDNDEGKVDRELIDQV